MMVRCMKKMGDVRQWFKSYDPSRKQFKMRSKTDEVALVGLKYNKACSYSFRDRPIRFRVENNSKNDLR